MSALERKALEVLGSYVSAVLAKSILTLSKSWAKVDMGEMRPGDGDRLLKQLEKGLKVYLKDPKLQTECLDRLKEIIAGDHTTEMASPQEEKMEIRGEGDIVASRTAGRDMCRRLGFSAAAQIKVATAISELARNIVQYAKVGTITIAPVSGPRHGVEITARDQGPGIDNLDTILEGDYSSKSGMGIGLKGTKKMMDSFQIDTGPDKGTVVIIRKFVS